jgi:predicted acylesterase/phospholipase RssA/ABC-type phosphate/phosphonate transport system substrate-binding protein
MALVLLRTGLVVCLALLGTAAAGKEVVRDSLRVGIVAYDDVRSRAAVLKADFEEAGFSTRFARGTADEVLDWVSDGLVDVAVLSPGALAATGAYLPQRARLAAKENGTFPRWDARYLVTRELGAAQSPFAAPARREDGGFVYQALALVDKAAWEKLRSKHEGSDADVVKKASFAGEIQFVFGDPLSLSGTIVPKAQLRKLGVIYADRWEFSFGHSDTIGLLLNHPTLASSNGPLTRVGFVFDASVPKTTDGAIAHDAAWRREQIARMSSELVSIVLPPPLEAGELLPHVEKMRQRHGLNDPHLTADDLPGEVMVTRPDMSKPDRDRIRDGLLRIREPASGRRVYQDQAHAEPGEMSEIELVGLRVRHWANLGEVGLGAQNAPRQASVAEIVHSMRHYERQWGKPARLALVLSGGGAKCAYQAGAIMSIEKALRSLRGYDMRLRSKSESRRPVDIELVVGTSGGALNALPTAIGITAEASEDNQGVLAALWRNVHLTNLLEPAPALVIAVGVALGAAIALFGSVAGVCLDALVGLARAGRTWLRRRRNGIAAAPAEPRDSLRLRRWVRMVVNATAFGVLIAFGLWLHIDPEAVLESTPDSRAIYYLLWLPLHVAWPGVLGFVGVVCLVHVLQLARRPGGARSRMEDVTGHAAVASAAVCALGVVFFFSQTTISRGEKMELAVFKSLHALFKGRVEPSKSIAGGLEQQASALSSAIASPELQRRRDFVMTVSLLGNHRLADRYAYLPAARGGDDPSYKQRAISLIQRSELSFMDSYERLVDLIVASGTIFPIFPPRVLVDSTGRGEDVHVIDGGFAHNIPIEAAVDWGATHIIAIEASPSTDFSQKENFLQNVGLAFDHLFSQAQMVDVRSRSGVEIYTLQPQKEILKTFEFIPAFVDLAVAQGYDDAEAGRFLQYSKAPRMMKLDEVQQQPVSEGPSAVVGRSDS